MVLRRKLEEAPLEHAANLSMRYFEGYNLSSQRRCGLKTRQQLEISLRPFDMVKQRKKKIRRIIKMEPALLHRLAFAMSSACEHGVPSGLGELVNKARDMLAEVRYSVAMLQCDNVTMLHCNSGLSVKVSQSRYSSRLCVKTLGLTVSTVSTVSIVPGDSD